MGLVCNFFGLLFCGGYVAYVLLSGWSTKRKDEERWESFCQSFHDIDTLLTDYELDHLVDRFMSKSMNRERINSMLSEDIAYIISGDDTIVLSNQQIKDLIMSKFGKVSTLTRIECTRFGKMEKAGKALSSYDVSVRVMQCVESNIKNATGRIVLFGASRDPAYCNGQYPNAVIKAIGRDINAIRIYSSVSIPYTAVSKEDLLE